MRNLPRQKLHESEPLKLQIKAVTKSTWADFTDLFESKGGPRYCYCMLWRKSLKGEPKSDGPTRKICMQNLVNARRPVGILGYLGKMPIAWCSLAPKEAFEKIDSGITDSANVWSLSCMFIKREFRGQRITGQLIEGAMAHAAKNGAMVLEAYPVEKDSPSYRFSGFISSFKRLGFQEVAKVGTRRHIYRKNLGGANLA